MRKAHAYIKKSGLNWILVFLGIKEVPSDKRFYRVKEFNKAYDFKFGEGKGWIYCSNEIQGRNIAEKYARLWTKETGLKTEVIPI